MMHCINFMKTFSVKNQFESENSKQFEKEKSV